MQRLVLRLATLACLLDRLTAATPDRERGESRTTLARLATASTLGSRGHRHADILHLRLLALGTALLVVLLLGQLHGLLERDALVGLLLLHHQLHPIVRHGLD